MIDPVEHLARDDKWQLGAGDGTLFAPASPRWLDRPGFWDGATIHHFDFAPLFTVAICDADGREQPCVAQSRRWTPADLTVTYTIGAKITATEVRTVHPGGVFVSEWRFMAMEPTTLHVVAWTAQDGASVPVGSAAWAGAVGFSRTLRGVEGTELRVHAELACLGETSSWGVARSDERQPDPLWVASPFTEHWARALPSRVAGDTEASGTLHAAVHRAVRIDYQGASAVFAMRVSAEGGAESDRPAARPVRPRHGTIAGASRRRWHAWFEKVPRVRCSDPYIETAYLYRWYTLYQNGLGSSTPALPAAIAEGLGTRHRVTARSTSAIVRELRWLGEDTVARSHLRALLGTADSDGALLAAVTAGEPPEALTADASIGLAWQALEAAWPDAAHSREVHDALARHADRLMATRDADRSGLFDGEVHEGPTGKDVLASADAYALFRTLEAGADDASARTKWRQCAERTRDAMRTRLWDAEAGVYRDLHPDGSQVATLRATGFAPGAVGFVETGQIDAMVRVLTDPRRFAAAFPVPSVALDDVHFSAEGEREGRRLAMPTNGRTWPADTARAIDALVQWSTHREALRRAAGDLLKRYVRMLFHDGDLRRPNGSEHYNPLTGRAADWRGADDVLMAPLADFVLTLAAGIQPHADRIVVDPFPLGLEQLTVSGVRIRQRALEVRLVGEKFTVISGGERHESTLGQPVTLDG